MEVETEDLPVCRACLRTSLEYVNLESLFKTTQTTTLMDAFSLTTNIDVKKNVNLSRSLCCSCCNELRIAFEFIQKAKMSDQKLKCINNFRKLDRILNEFNHNKPVITEVDSELDDLDGIFSETFVHSEEADKNKHAFPCNYCGAKFKSKYVLELHMERNHRNLPTKVSQDNYKSDHHNSEMSIVQNEAFQQIYYQPTVITVSNEHFNNFPVLASNYVIENEITEAEMIDRFDIDADFLIGQTIVVENDLENEKYNHLNNMQSKDTQTGKTYEIIRSNVFKFNEGNFTTNETNAEQKDEPDSNNSIGKFETQMVKKRAISSKIGKKLIDEILLSGHLTHNAIKPYQCECCIGKSLYTEQKIDNNDNSIQNETKIYVKCQLCKKLTKNICSHNNKYHTTVVKSSTNSTIPCKICGKTLSAKNMKAHVDSIHGDYKFLCSICPKIFTSRNNLQSHLQVHNKNREKTFECIVCFKKFYSNNLLRMHNKSHSSETYACNVCGKKFLRKIGLTLHLKKHNGETIKCKICSKDFVRTRELNIHMRFHTGECPFECTMCSESFPVKSSLNYHMRRKHLRCKYVCTFCNESFDHPNKLRKHRYEHIGKPFPCPKEACFRAFMGKKDLERHMEKIHKSQLTTQELKTIYDQHEKKRYKLVLSKTESNYTENII